MKKLNNKFYIIGLLMVISISVIGFSLNKSQALINDEANTGEDIAENTYTDENGYQLAYTINGKKAKEAFPNKDSGLTVNSVTCKNGVQASWNNEKWSLVISNSNAQNKILCKVDFSMSLPTKATDYIKYLNSNEIINDGTVDQNLRYVGANPKNYVSFNNELWRIIGVMNDVEDANGVVEPRIKLIRNESIGNFSWDYKQNGIGSSTSESGSNDWTDSQLMYMLNEYKFEKRPSPNYWQCGNALTPIIYFSDNNYKNYIILSGAGSYYYRKSEYAPGKTSTISTEATNSAEVKYAMDDLYNRSNKTEKKYQNIIPLAAEPCPDFSGSREFEQVDFSNIGLTEESRKMISEVKWKLGGKEKEINVYSNKAQEFYTKERGTEVYNGRATEWIGKVGLMYISDYVYATSGGNGIDRSNCYIGLNDWSVGKSTCRDNDWLYDKYASYQWTMTPSSSNDYSVFSVMTHGKIWAEGTRADRTVQPVVYLKSNEIIKSGTGTSDDPFVLKGSGDPIAGVDPV